MRDALILKKQFGLLRRELSAFVPKHDSSDRIWKFYLPLNRHWQCIRVVAYQMNLYVSGSHFDAFASNDKQNFRAEEQATLLDAIIAELQKIRAAVKRDPIIYHRTLLSKVPKSLRDGVIPRALVSALIPEYRNFNHELRRSEIRRMIRYLSTHHKSHTDTMTAQKFFDYCRVAYLANGRRSHKKMSLRASGYKLYDRWADNRDGGLKSIPSNSAGAFAKWYHGKTWQGCHPWEIYRGGNSTHIDLAVTWDEHQKKWRVLLSAFSSGRLAETCRIALALHKAGLPFELNYSASYLERLTGYGHIGIVPEHEGIKYAWHEFPKEFGVADCIHFSWFKDDNGKSLRPMNDIAKLVTWLPLPVLQLQNA